jgi:hypothetical protein
MVLRHLLVGASALAFAVAGSAQDNTILISSTSSSTPNDNTAQCVQYAGTNSNNCTITQNGTQNTAVGNQPGNGNESTIEQRTSANGAVTLNNAAHTQAGDRNTARTTQRTNSNTSTIAQRSSAITGEVGNSATVTQSGGNANQSGIQQRGRGQTATVTQTGAGNTSTITQGGGVSIFSGNAQGSGTGGIGNTATVTQTGSNLSSTISQQTTAAGGANNNQAEVTLLNNAALFDAAGQAGNRSSVTQSSSLNTATVAIANGDSIGAQLGSAFNQATVTQSTGSRNNAQVSIGNPVQASLASQNSSSTVTQNSTTGRNYAEVTITGGISGNDPGTNPNTGADTNGRSGGNTANVTQSGSTGRSTAVVTVAKLANFQGLGNSVTVTQTATGNYNGTASPAQGSAATADRIAVTEPAFAQAAGATGQAAIVYAQGRFGTITTQQQDDANSGVVYQDANGAVTGVARARVNVFQAGEVNTVTTSQVGDNFADITQGRLGSNNQPIDRRNLINLFQNDSGDGPGVTTSGTPETTFDEFGNPTTTTPTSTTSPRQYNQFLATQYGVDNEVQAQQQGRNNFMNVFQGTNSAGTAAVAERDANGALNTQPSQNFADLRQGTGNTAAFAGANAGTGQAGVQFPLQAAAAADGSGLNQFSNSANNTLNFVQGGLNNGTQVFQDSASSVITIRQLGSVVTANSPTAASFNAGNNQGQDEGNLVIVYQQGTSNRATATQTSTSGRSAANAPQSGRSSAENSAITGIPNTPQDDFFFAGGARSSQIVIVQGGVNNKALAEQRGLGQQARIEQAGTNNEAGILQQVNATNATAIIRQSGDRNTYFVEQTTAGQYIAVDQSGTGNNSNQIVQRGGAGGSNGFTAPTGFPGF